MTRGMRWRIIVLQVGLTGILAFAAGFLYWANSFTHDMVTTQLSEQKITFPTVGTKGFDAQSLPNYSEISQYAGQQLTTGPQAKAYANDYIAVHLQSTAKGQTYSQVSAAYIAAQADKSTPAATLTTLSSQRQTLFMGETLRGLLLNGYGWWQVGQYAFYAAIGFTVGAAVVFGALLFELAIWFLAARKAREVTVLPVGKARPSPA